MNFLQRSAQWFANKVVGLASESKFYDVPTIVGGPDILRQFIGGDSSWGIGKRLSTYKKSLYVFACVSKIAQKTASIDWQLFKITNTDGDKEEVFSHPALDLLYRPNPFQTKEEFFERYIINKKLAGCSFILKVRDAKGEVRELWNLRPDYMTMVLDKQKMIRHFEFMVDGNTVIFQPEDIIYSAYTDPESEFGGLSPIQPAQARVDVEYNATNYQRNFFLNNARPDFLLKTDKRLTDEQKTEMKESWDKRHKGSRKAGRGAILEGGLDYQQVSISQREMDYIESLKMTRDDILVVFGVPKPIVAITDDVNLANAETGMRIFISETIVPEIKNLTNKLNEHLIYSEYGDIFFLDFENPVPENKREKAEIQALRITAGTMVINEARQEWGDEPISGGWTLRVPFGLQSVGGIPQNGGGVPTDEEPVEEDDETKRARIARQKRVFNRRPKALKILKAKKKIKRAMYETLVENLKNGDERSFTPPEHREMYYQLVNKAIDERGKSLEKAMTEYALEEQMPRAFKALGLNSKDLHSKLAGDIDAALSKWAKSEAKLTAEFVIPFIADFLKSSGDQAMALVAPGESFDQTTERIVKYLTDRSRLFGSETTKTTLEKLSGTLSEGIAADEGIADLTKRVSTVFEQFPASRSEMIARTEATSANNRGFVEAYRQSGVANANEWIATNDSRTRDSHIAVDGQIVKLDDRFSNGLLYPGDGSADPSETINCRCVLAPAFKE